jgi:hypothetical protein
MSYSNTEYLDVYIKMVYTSDANIYIVIVTSITTCPLETWISKRVGMLMSKAKLSLVEQGLPTLPKHLSSLSF